jgi:NADH-quinone oxidoreductase subunit M
MLLSGIMLKMGIYALIRWLIPLFPLGLQFWTPYILVLCVIGIIYGAIIAIKQDNLKNLLAFSSLSHVGLIAAGSFILTKEGLQGSLIQMLAHGVNVFGLFYIAEIIISRTSTLSIAQLGGIRNVAPKFFTFTLILALAAVGLPTTNAFIGEFLLLFSLFQYNTYLAIAAGLTIILGAVYMFRMVQNTFLGPINLRTQTFTDLNATEVFIFVVLTFTIFTFGLFPNLVFETASPIFDKILQTALR